MGTDIVVGIDLATKDVRVLCAGPDGRVRAQGARPLAAPRTPRPGWVEQDPAGWWDATAAALREATDDLGADRAAIVSVAVSATSGTVLLADGTGDPASPALPYNDQRAVDEADAARRTGSRHWDRLGMRVNATFGLPKIAWLMRHAESDSVRWAWHASDLIVARLTGDAPPTDWSHALKTGCDPLAGAWPQEVLEALRIPARMLPEVRAPASFAGEVCSAAAHATGLPAGAQVRLGMTDSCAGQLAAGAARPGRFVGVLGTTLVVRGVSETLLRDPTGALYSHRHPSGWWLPGGASNTGGAALVEHCARADLASWDGRAARHGPATCVIYPLTGTGERFPFLAPEARGFGLGTPADDTDRYRAILEGVAFMERLSYVHMARTGADIRAPVAGAGAGSTSKVWNRIRAAVLDAPVTASRNATTAFGACVLAASGVIHADADAAASAMARSGEEVHGAQEEREALMHNYARFVDALVERGWIDEDLRARAANPVVVR